MVELGIQVKMSARQMTEEEAEKKISNVRTGLKTAVAFFSAVGIFFTINVLYTDPVIVADPSKWHLIADTTIFISELILISISLASSYWYLSVNISQHFAEELKDEGNRIKAIFVFFSLSFISRAVVYLLVVCKVI